MKDKYKISGPDTSGIPDVSQNKNKGTGGAVLCSADIADNPSEIADEIEDRKKLPLISKILFIVAAVSIVIYIAARIWEPFADFFSRYPGAIIRALLAHLTNWLPFSLAEAMLLFIPAALFFLIRTAVKKYSASWHDTLVYMAIITSVASLLVSLLICGFGTAYFGSTLDKKLGLDKQDVSAEELRDTAQILADAANKEAENVTFRKQNFSVMPYSLEEMNDKLLDAYDKVHEKYPFIQKLTSRLKPVVLSEPWSYTHITGVYTYFTGESNINVNFPDYTIPYTAAHELAHQRGIAREEEANFIAFLVCLESDDPYIRYSGYLNMYEYVSSSLYSANQKMYSQVRETLSDKIRFEMKAYSKFFDKYRENVVANVSQSVNNAYLQSQGTAGVKSYGMVTDLAVAYYKNAK